jgi:chromosome partitioning protein
MKIVALVAEKGGSGKSSIAVHLAVCASMRGLTVAVIDLDPQGSAGHWAERRGEGAGVEVVVVAAKAQELPGLLASARQQGAALVILDTAGRSDVTTAHVLEAADVALIPCRASIYDLESARHTAALVATALATAPGKRAAFVLNATPPRGTRAQEARAALEGLLPVAPVELHQLVAYADALNDGQSVEELEPHGKAAQEIRALYDWLMGL